jgi:hypothetical protein
MKPQKYQRQINVVGDGNSLMAGSGSTAGHDPIALLQNLLIADGNYSTCVNFGVGGQTISFMQSDAVSQIDSLDITARTYLVGLEGVNHWYTNPSESLDTIFNKYKQYFLDRKSAGSKYVIAGTCMVAGSAIVIARDWETWRVAFNARIKAEFPALGIYVADLAGSPLLQDYNNTTYFQTDKVHLTNAGYAVYADVFAKTILNI